MEARPAMTSQRPRPLARGGARACILCAGLALALLSACSSGLPRPPTGRIPADALVEVPYPPPPAHVEVIPPQKNPRDVWIDGQWDWDGKAWKWTDGAWQAPPANAYFTAWTTVRRGDGQLFFARAAWRGKDGRALDLDGPNACPVLPAGRAAASPGEVAKR
jgi:hypothetical protein